MPDLAVPAALKQIDEADEVGLGIGLRIDERVAHAGLGGEVDDALEVFLAEEFGHARGIGDVELDEAKARMVGQLLQARLLQADVVIVVEVVDADDLVAARQQALGNVHSYKSGGAGDEHFHASGFRKVMAYNSVFWRTF